MARGCDSKDGFQRVASRREREFQPSLRSHLMKEMAGRNDVARPAELRPEGLIALENGRAWRKTKKSLPL